MDERMDEVVGRDGRTTRGSERVVHQGCRVAVAIDVDVVVASRRRSRRPTRGAARAPRRRAAAATTAMTTTSEHEAARAHLHGGAAMASSSLPAAATVDAEMRLLRATAREATTRRHDDDDDARASLGRSILGMPPTSARHGAMSRVGRTVSRAPTTSDEASRCLRLWLQKQQRAARAASALSSGRARAPLGSTTAPAML